MNYGLPAFFPVRNNAPACVRPDLPDGSIRHLKAQAGDDAGFVRVIKPLDRQDIPARNERAVEMINAQRAPVAAARILVFRDRRISLPGLRFRANRTRHGAERFTWVVHVLCRGAVARIGFGEHMPTSIRLQYLIVNPDNGDNMRSGCGGTVGRDG